MLEQALATLKVEPESITWERWEALQKEFGARSQLEILADIGLGKRLSFAVAQALTRPAGKAADEPRGGAVTATMAGKPPPLTLRGVEGVAIQYARCCRPVPGDALVGQFRKGQGLLVHTRDCVTLRKQRADPDQLIDVEWAADVQGVFDAGIRLLVADRRGLLAEVATAIADAGANIDNVSMERPDGGEVLAMFFSVQVKDRRHLAHVIRAVKRVPTCGASSAPGLSGAASAGRARHHDASRSGVALILWMVRSAPWYSSSASRRSPTAFLSPP